MASCVSRSIRLFIFILIASASAIAIPIAGSLGGGTAWATAAFAKKHGRSKNFAAVAADHAKAQIGRPYKFSGSSPKGFDCSGLVYYSFKKAGVIVPRKVADQRSMSIAIKRSQVRKGDLLFFNEEGKKSSHVGIYLGKGYFVHAPSTGGRVKSASLNSAYWKKSFHEARRVPKPVVVGARRVR